MQKSVKQLSFKVVCQPKGQENSCAQTVFLAHCAFTTLIRVKASECYKKTFSLNNYCVVVPPRTNPHIAWWTRHLLFIKKGVGKNTMSEESSLGTRHFGWKTPLQESQLADFYKWSIDNHLFCSVWLFI